MSILFQPLSLRDLHLANRVVVAPMCQYSAVDGEVQPWHFVHLGQLAMASAGMLVLEATSVEDIGRITPGCLGLYNDAQEKSLGELISSLRELNSQHHVPICIQLSHAGRKGSSYAPWATGAQIPLDAGGWVCAAPSGVAHKIGELVPRELTASDLVNLTAAFVSSVERAERIGIDAVELHCAHGYLMHQFLSPVANRRTDEYGGTLENRVRYPLELFAAMRGAWPAEKPMGVRLSATDWDESSSWSIQEAVYFSERLAELGCDWIDVSSGGVSSQQKIELKPGYQVAFAAAIKQAVEMPVMAVGLITEASQAEAILQSGQADMIALARAFLYNPRWVWHAAAELGAQVVAPSQYWRCAPANTGRVFGDTPIGQR